MAQQRNVDDPATVIEFAQIVKGQSNLDALMLITLADGQGTTDAWSDWKESLVWNLYHATSRYLQDQEGFIAQGKLERARLHDAVAARVRPDFAEEIEAHFDYMPDNYFRAFGVEEIVAHLELFRTFWHQIYREDQPGFTPAFRWARDAGTTVIAQSRLRPGISRRNFSPNHWARLPSRRSTS